MVFTIPNVKTLYVLTYNGSYNYTKKQILIVILKYHWYIICYMVWQTTLSCCKKNSITTIPIYTV